MTDNTEAVEKLDALIWNNMTEYKSGCFLDTEKVLAAIQADPLAYVKPKPLEWKVDILEVTTEIFGIESYYEIETLCGVRLRINGELEFSYEDLEAAQAAAYDDLCNRMKELF